MLVQLSLMFFNKPFTFTTLIYYLVTHLLLTHLLFVLDKRKKRITHHISTISLYIITAILKTNNQTSSRYHYSTFFLLFIINNNNKTIIQFSTVFAKKINNSQLNNLFTWIYCFFNLLSEKKFNVRPFTQFSFALVVVDLFF